VQLLVRVREGLTRRLYDLAMGDEESKIATPQSPASEKTMARRWSSQPLRKKKSFGDLLSTFPTATIAPVWVEGAYGNLTHLDWYPTLLLVAGGSGVSFTLPILLDIVRRRRAMCLGDRDVAVATERLIFVWTIRDPGASSVLVETCWC